MKININNLPIIGAICGDILGSFYEWQPVKKLDHSLCTQEDEFTDDTVCTVAIADAILNGKSFTTTLKEWCRRYPKAGYGGSFRRWMMSDTSQPYNSWGNGSAMRVSAVGAMAKTLDEALELAKHSAEVTHNHPEGIKGAQSVAAAIFLAKEGASKDEIKDYIQDTFGYDLNRDYHSIQRGYCFDVSCMGSVPESIISFLVSSSYEDAIRHAIALGGDADTMAAIAGSIAAAYYKVIPRHIIEHCIPMMTNEMIDVINQTAGANSTNSSFTLCYPYQRDCDLDLIKEQIDIINENAIRYGFDKLVLNEKTGTIFGEYKPLITKDNEGLKELACESKNHDFKNELVKLERLCRLSKDSNTITLSNGNHLECHIADCLKHDTKGSSEEEKNLFYSNILLFIEHTDEILNDSRMFLTPIYSQSFSPFFCRPTLGAFIEWWRYCIKNPVEKNGYPICFISGNPMTGSHACSAVTPDGEIVKAELCVSFIDLLKSFGRYTSRYRFLSDFCQTYSLREIIDKLSTTI